MQQLQQAVSSISPTAPAKRQTPTHQNAAFSIDRRQGNDRRQRDLPVLLDTRSNRERRRQTGRRPEDKLRATIDRRSIRGFDDYA